jgi:hypothetical protein
MDQEWLVRFRLLLRVQDVKAENTLNARDAEEKATSNFIRRTLEVRSMSLFELSKEM